MFKLSLLLVCMIALGCLVDLAVSKYNRRDSYAKINDYLVDHVDSDEIEPNLSAANKWLKEIKSKDDNMTLAECFLAFDLGNFVLLEKVWNNEACHYDEANKVKFSLNVVKDNLARDPAQWRRIDTIIYNVVSEYEKRCKVSSKRF